MPIREQLKMKNSKFKKWQTILFLIFNFSFLISKVLAGGDGSATIAPATIPQGSVLDSTLTYTVGTGGITAGGQVVVTLPSFWGPSILQNNNITTDGYVSSTVSVAAVYSITLGTSTTSVTFTLTSGSLSNGDTISFYFTHLHSSCPQPTATQALWSVQSSSTSTDTPASIASLPSQTYTTGPAQWLVYEPWNPITVISGQASNGIVIRGSDGCGNAVNVATTTVITLNALYQDANFIYQTDSSALFALDSGMSLPITTITISVGQSSTTFYYRTGIQGNNLAIRGDYTSFQGPFVQQLWRNVTSLSSFSFGNISIDFGSVVAGQTSLSLTPDGSGTNDHAYIRFLPSNSNLQWHVTISSSGFNNIVFERWGSGDPQSTVVWDGHNMFAQGNVVPNGTYVVKIEVIGLTANTSLSMAVNSSQISGQVTLGGSPAVGAFVNAQNSNGPGYSFAVTDTLGNYTLNGLKSANTYNLFCSFTDPTSQGQLQGFLSNIAAPTSGQNFIFQTPGRIRVAATLTAAAPSPSFGSINANTSDYKLFANANIRFVAGATASDNGDTVNPSTWSILTVQPNTYTLKVNLPGYGANTQSVTVAAGQTADIILPLAPKATVYGKITLPGPAVSNSWVSVEGTPSGSPGPTIWGGASFNVGQSTAIYTIFSVDPGTYSLLARLPGYVPLVNSNVIVGSVNLGDSTNGGGSDFSGFSIGGSL